MREVLIGTGFFSTVEDHDKKLGLFVDWWRNTTKAAGNIVAVDNSEFPLSDVFKGVRIIRNRRNLGHACAQCVKGGPLLGWSMSWIQPALIAYAEGCNFIYKEQDCFAFGDWIKEIDTGGMSFGLNKTVDCEQSLFFIRHEFILTSIRYYMAISRPDWEMLPESKFARMRQVNPYQISFHNLPGGRDRPLPDTSKPFYAQRLTEDEFAQLRKEKLL